MKQSELHDFVVTDFECPDCEKSFDTEMGVKVHHSKKHDGTLARPFVECAQCGDEKRVPSWQTKNCQRHFCSNDCKSKWQRENLQGEKHPLWSRVEKTCDECGEDYTVKRAYAQNSRWCSQTCQMQGLKDHSPSGHKHPHWNGAIRSLTTQIRLCISDKSWTKTANEYRDSVGNECEWCGKSPAENGREMDVHHIIPLRNGGTNDKELLMALCCVCHSKAERYCAKIFGSVINENGEPNEPLLPTDA